MYTKIVVPLDGSELAELALEEAQCLSRLTSAPIHLVRVVDLVNGKPYGAYIALEAAGYAEALSAEASECVEYLARVQAALAARGLTVTTEILRGPAAHEITQSVQPGDLIVMATHGRGGVRRWLIGSVAEAVIRHSPVPVLLVRADQARRRTAESAAPVDVRVLTPA